MNRTAKSNIARASNRGTTTGNISHREWRADHFLRLENGQWLISTHLGSDRVELPLLGGSFATGDLSAGVVF